MTYQIRIVVTVYGKKNCGGQIGEELKNSSKLQCFYLLRV